MSNLINPIITSLFWSHRTKSGVAFEIWLKSLFCCHHVVWGSNHIQAVSNCQAHVKGELQVKETFLVEDDFCLWVKVWMIMYERYIYKMPCSIFSAVREEGGDGTVALFCVHRLLYPSPYILLTRKLFWVQHSLKVLKKPSEMCYSASGCKQSYTYPASCFECVNRGKMVFCFCCCYYLVKQ